MIFNTFRTDLDKAINEVLAKHGMDPVTIDLRKYRGTDRKVRLMSMDMEVKSASGSTSKPEASKSLDPRLDAAMAMYKIRSTSNAKGDRLVGFNPRAPKYVFVYESARGTRWKCTSAQAQARFGRIA